MSGTERAGTTSQQQAAPARDAAHAQPVAAAREASAPEGDVSASAEPGPGAVESPAPPAPPGRDDSSARGRRRAPTAGDMLRSMLVLVIPILIITWIFTRTPDQPQVPTVNWQPVYTTAQKSAPYRLLTPSDLPSGWRPTRVQWTPEGTSDDAGNLSAGDAWTLGFLSPHTIYFAIRQTDGPAQPFIAHVTRDGTRDGTSTVTGATWTRYVSEDGRTRALVRRSGSVTSIVAADAPYAALESFAGHLHT